MGDSSFETLLIGWGSVWGAIDEAVRLLNQGKTGGAYAALVFGDIYPLPTKLLREKAAEASRIIDVEQNATGQLAALIQEETGIICDDKILRYDGRQISGEEIAEQVRKEGIR